MNCVSKFYFSCKKDIGAPVNQKEINDFLISTERVYLTWLRALYRFVKGKSPADLDNTDAKDFMIHLTADRKVAPSTQNQAFSAILFFSRFVLDQQLDDMQAVLRAHQRRRLPVVLTKSEIRTIQELLGHSSVKTTMVFTHVAAKNLMGVKSPLDQ